MASAWIVAITAGFFVLVDYELKAGRSKAHPSQWPADAGLALDSRQPNLVLFAHPRCPCSRATVAELEKIVTGSRDKVTTTVFFFSPGNEAADWPHTDLWRRAASIPGVNVQPDRDGRTATRFGAITSGQALLFDSAGRLLFSGGITGARGHEGENEGRRAVVARVSGRENFLIRTPVFGCSLVNETSETSTQ